MYSFTFSLFNAFASAWIFGASWLPSLTQRIFTYGESAPSMNNPSFEAFNPAGKA